MVLTRCFKSQVFNILNKREAPAILSYGRAGMRIPSRRIVTRLRKMKGIKEIKINHVSHTVKIHYDPSVVTIEKIRTVLEHRAPES